MVVNFQFSLPQTSLEMATVEKLLQMQPDSVPCKIRAKRGCATHPRSIAERVCNTAVLFACIHIVVIIIIIALPHQSGAFACMHMYVCKVYL